MKKSVTHGLLRAGLKSVHSTKLRSFWTMLGVIIGVTSVITVVAIGDGIKHQVSGQIHHLGKNLIVIRPEQSELTAFAGVNTTGPITKKDINTVAKMKGVAASAPLTIANGQVSGDRGKYKDGFAVGTTSDLPSLLNQSLKYGGFLTEDDIGARAAVLGPNAAEALFNVDVPLGRTFQFRGEEFIVRGVFNQFSSAPLSQQLDFNNAVFIPQAVAEELSNNTAPTYQILARPSDNDQISAAMTNIDKALAKNHGGQDEFSVLAGNQNIETNNNILSLLTKLIAGVAAISLLVSGIGIMNVMLVSVAERKHEIGIRKAVGATNRQILSQFMIESSILSLWGGLIGIGLAFLINGALRVFTNLQPVITWQVVVLATGVSLLVGIVFGTVPALKAARKDPIEALRSE